MIEIIPIQIRKAFYLLPAFLTWIVGYTWEHDEGAKKAAYRGYGLFLLFCGGTAVIFVLTESITLISGKLDIVSKIIGLIMQAFVSFGYTVLSSFLAYLEYRGEPYTLPVVDNLIEKLTELLDNL